MAIDAKESRVIPLEMKRDFVDRMDGGVAQRSGRIENLLDTGTESLAVGGNVLLVLEQDRFEVEFSQNIEVSFAIFPRLPRAKRERRSRPIAPACEQRDRRFDSVLAVASHDFAFQQLRVLCHERVHVRNPRLAGCDPARDIFGQVQPACWPFGAIFGEEGNGSKQRVVVRIDTEIGMVEINQLANALDDAVKLLLPEGHSPGWFFFVDVRQRGKLRPWLKREHSNLIADGLRGSLNDHERAKRLAVGAEVGGQNQAHEPPTSNPVVRGCHVQRARYLQMRALDDILCNF